MGASILLVSIMFSLTATLPAAGQKLSKQEQKAAKVKEKLKKLGVGDNVKIKVKLLTGTTYEGHLTAVNDDNFVIVDKSGSSNTVKYSEVEKIGGKNLSTGAKIGIGVGIGAGLTVLILWLIFENYG